MYNTSRRYLQHGIHHQTSPSPPAVHKAKPILWSSAQVAVEAVRYDDPTETQCSKVHRGKSPQQATAGSSTRRGLLRNAKRGREGSRHQHAGTRGPEECRSTMLVQQSAKSIARTLDPRDRISQRTPSEEREGGGRTHKPQISTYTNTYTHNTAACA